MTGNDAEKRTLNIHEYMKGLFALISKHHFIYITYLFNVTLVFGRIGLTGLIPFHRALAFCRIVSEKNSKAIRPPLPPKDSKIPCNHTINRIMLWYE